MSAILNKIEAITIFTQVENHPSYHGDVPGLIAEKMVRGKTPFKFMIRQGERSTDKDEKNYYVTFMLPDGSVKHQPLVITMGPLGWSYENCKPGGPYKQESITDVLHLIMHCQENECIPLIK